VKDRPRHDEASHGAEWDESPGVWKDRPRHDEASHGADAFLTLTCNNYTPPSDQGGTMRSGSPWSG
jgi:hypothetical protein